MSRRKHLVGIFICALAVAAFHWSIADFHPGGDVTIPSDVRRQADVGRAMAHLFIIPLIWVTRVTGFSSAFLAVQWVVLPLLYGTVIFYLARLLWRLARHVSEAGERRGA